MSEQETNSWSFLLVCFFIIFSGKFVAGESLDTDKQVLLNLKSYLENQTFANRGQYTTWNKNTSNPCEWEGISCSFVNEKNLRVVGVDISASGTSGKIFQNLSHLTELTHLDLSQNSFFGVVPEDLRNCQKLVFLNLSHNLLEGKINLIGLTRLETLDLSMNRFYGELGENFPAICDSLVSLNVSDNHFSGRIDECFEQCMRLQYLDLSTNNFNGVLWNGTSRLREFSVSENHLSVVPSNVFSGNCSLEKLDLSVNEFVGEAPKEVANCKSLLIIDLSSNGFIGDIPKEIGLISGLEALFLENNSFSRNIPETLLDLKELFILDLSKNGFGGDIQKIFGRFKRLKFLRLNSNSYTGGLSTSGILTLTNLSRLDLSCNNFSGRLPIEFSKMSGLTFLTLTYNKFTGPIPSELGNLTRLQALELAFNYFSGPIPPSFGNLRSLLWLMLAENLLSGGIPPELGNCTSLLWLNLANNKLSGMFPAELTKIGRNAMATFELNKRNLGQVVAGNSGCSSMRRWIPADYPPFSFVYTILTRKNCRALWDRLLKGYGIFPVCTSNTSSGSTHISGYVQVSGNQLIGEIPQEIGNMFNFSMLHLGDNKFSGKFPLEMTNLPLVVLNMTRNKFSGEIPNEIGNMKCLQDLDLSWNNFSGQFPTSLANLDELSSFNISYNPFISGEVPPIGHLLTFDEYSYLGDPLLKTSEFIDHNPDPRNKTPPKALKKKPIKWFLFLALILTIFVFVLILLIVYLLVKSPSVKPGYLLRDKKQEHDLNSSSSRSSPWFSDGVKIFHLNKTVFTHSDILAATSNFAENRIIGKGGFGTVYRGLFPDGREVAVKRLQREGTDGEKEFKAEMKILSGHGFGWSHPNLVTLYGWCLDGSQKILVYEYVGCGSLEDLVTDTTKLTWKRRLEVAIDVARALVYLHHECYPSILHRDVKASNVLLDKEGKAKVTDFGLARVVDVGVSHVSTIVAGTVGYVAPEYGQTWQATTKGDVYSFGVLIMELATGKRALDGGEECLVEWARRVMGIIGKEGLNRSMSVLLMGFGLVGGIKEMGELLQVGVRCTNEAPHARPNMKEVLNLLIKLYNPNGDSNHGHLA